MALTRKMLKAMGIEDEKIDQIIDAHSETVDALKEERDTYKKDAEQLPSVQRQLDALEKAQAEDGTKSPYKVKYEALKEEYDTLKTEFESYKTSISQKNERDAKVRAFRDVLKTAGVVEKRIDSVIKVSDAAIDSVVLDKDGKAENAEALSKAIQEEWSDFIATTGDKKDPPEAPPASYNNLTKKDFAAMTYAERVKLKEADPALYQKLKGV